MPFENDTNHKRVQKAIETLELIEASRVSNKASQKDMADMLKPLMEYLGVGEKTPQLETAEEPKKSATEEPKEKLEGMAALGKDKWSAKPNCWDIRDAAVSASLPDLLYALAVIQTRFGDFFDDVKKSKVFIKGLD